MGYQRKIYKITFADPELEGLEVVTRPPSVDQVLDLGDGVEAMKEGTASREVVLQMANLFVSCMVSWTVEEEDGSPAPLPSSGKDLMTEDASMAMAMLTEWSQRAIRVAPPLPESSSGGGTSALEQSIPMAPRSPSQPSSEGPG